MSMIFGGPDQDIEQRRTMLGLAFLVVGLLLLMWAWGSWMYRAATTSPTGVKPAIVEQVGTPNEKSEKAVRIAPSMMLGGLLLFVVFMAATFVLVRASRRYRLSLGRRSPAPTPTKDIWSMHKLKEFPDDEA